MDLQEVTSHRVPASGRTFVRVTISFTQEAFFQISQYVVRSEHLGSAAMLPAGRCSSTLAPRLTTSPEQPSAVTHTRWGH